MKTSRAHAGGDFGVIENDGLETDVPSVALVPVINSVRPSGQLADVSIEQKCRHPRIDHRRIDRLLGERQKLALRVDRRRANGARELVVVLAGESRDASTFR